MNEYQSIEHKVLLEWDIYQFHALDAVVTFGPSFPVRYPSSVTITHYVFVVCIVIGEHYTCNVVTSDRVAGVLLTY
jgi:hypothetical protein